MNKEYCTPICCEDFMELKNVMGNAFPNYFIFHCDRCGRIKLCCKEELDVFEVESE